MPSDEDAEEEKRDAEMAKRRATLHAEARKKAASKEARRSQVPSPRPSQLPPPEAEESKPEAAAAAAAEAAAAAAAPKKDSAAAAEEPTPEAGDAAVERCESEPGTPGTPATPVSKPNAELPIKLKPAPDDAAGEDKKGEPASCPASSLRKKAEDDKKPGGALNLPRAGAGRKSIRSSTQVSADARVSFLAPAEKDARPSSQSPSKDVRAISKAASDFGGVAAAEKAKAPSFRHSVRLISTTNRLSVKKESSGKDVGGGSSSSSGVPGGRKTVHLSDNAGRRMTRIATTGSSISYMDKDATPKPRRLPEEEALSTKEDAWDLLLIDESGQRQRTLTVEALADVFDELRASGLDASIVPHLRLRPEVEFGAPVEARSPKASGRDTSPRQERQVVAGRHIKCLCMMLLKDQLYEEYPTDPEEIENFNFQLQMDVDLGKTIDYDLRINFKSFKKIVDFVSKMLCLDEALIIMQIVWIKTGRFEMNFELHTAIAAIAKWRDAAFEFKKNQLDILVHSSGILNKTRKSDLNWGNFHQQFDKFLLQKLDLLKDRQDRKNAPKPQENHEFFAKGYHSSDTVCGRTEFGLWLETVFAFANKHEKVYRSPLAMSVEWIRTSRLLEEENSSSNSSDDEVDPEKAATKAKLRSDSDVVFKEMKKKAKETETMKDRFKRMDLNSNGSLDFNEFQSFLLSGTPHLSGKELRGLFKSADVNGDGIIVFEEFVDFIHGSEERLQDEQPIAPEGVRLVYKAYCSSNGEQIDASHFSKILKAAQLIDNELTMADVDIIFNRMRNPNERVLALPQFERALKHCAEKKGVELGEVYEAIWTVPIEVVPKESLDTKASKGQKSESKVGGFLQLGWLKGSKSAKVEKTPNSSPRKVAADEGRSDGSPTSAGMRASKSMPRLAVGVVDAKRASKKISAREA